MDMNERASVSLNNGAGASEWFGKFGAKVSDVMSVIWDQLGESELGCGVDRLKVRAAGPDHPFRNMRRARVQRPASLDHHVVRLDTIPNLTCPTSGADNC